jgi:ABC-type nitrate/sulfonate/bicarbonate transport system permease component
MDKTEKMKNKIIYLALGIFLIMVWQYFGSTNQTVRLLLSSPSLIVQYFGENYASLLDATKMTFIEAIVGLLIAATFSFGMMILCFYIPKMMEFILPLMIISQVIPLIVLAPFFIILMGIGIWSKITMAALMCFFPIFVNFAQGYKAISTNLHELMLIYNADTWTCIKNVYFPLSMPSIMAGLKISATLAVIGAIVAEFTGAEVGLGRNLYISALRLEPEMMMSSLVLSALLGLVLFGIAKIIENKIKWINE